MLLKKCRDRGSGKMVAKPKEGERKGGGRGGEGGKKGGRRERRKEGKETDFVVWSQPILKGQYIWTTSKAIARELALVLWPRHHIKS